MVSGQIRIGNTRKNRNVHCPKRSTSLTMNFKKKKMVLIVTFSWVLKGFFTSKLSTQAKMVSIPFQFANISNIVRDINIAQQIKINLFTKILLSQCNVKGDGRLCQYLHVQHLSTMIFPFTFFKFWLFLKLNIDGVCGTFPDINLKRSWLFL